jgi:L-gulono-1,4-lactone dehydrogenase
LRATYPRFDDFLAVRDKLDPNRTFGNDYLTQVLGG